jgi:hypothetical protein
MVILVTLGINDAGREWGWRALGGGFASFPRSKRPIVLGVQRVFTSYHSYIVFCIIDVIMKSIVFYSL